VRCEVRAHNPEVAGSNPAPATTKVPRYAHATQHPDYRKRPRDRARCSLVTGMPR
jgi:hypothetical protein